MTNDPAWSARRHSRSSPEFRILRGDLMRTGTDCEMHDPLQQLDSGSAARWIRIILGCPSIHHEGTKNTKQGKRMLKEGIKRFVN
jgi:hypothetical protein